MSHVPHDLSDEFPGRADLIHELKASDGHFARLVDDYDQINRAIHRAETNLEPTDELHETEMRKQRMLLKDQIAQALSAPTRS